jgi:hypothetical protein
MGKTLLRQLERPMRFTDLSKTFSPDIDVAGEIARLQKRDLLFHEDDRLFSLVLDLTHERRRTAGLQRNFPASNGRYCGQRGIERTTTKKPVLRG